MEDNPTWSLREAVTALTFTHSMQSIIFCKIRAVFDFGIYKASKSLVNFQILDLSAFLAGQDQGQ